MAVSHKGAISFGLVHIPVSLYTAIGDNSIGFNLLHKSCGQRIRYKKTCPACNIENVKQEDIVKGFEYEEGKYVIMTDDDFEKIKSPKDKTIHIIQFAKLNEIDPIFFEKSYYAVPDAGGDKAFELLRTVMLSENMVAIAKSVMGTKENLLTIRPTNDGLIVEIMYYLEEIKPIPKSYTKPQLNETEINMAKMLVNSMAKEFKPEEYRDEYQEKVKNALKQKIEGKEIIEEAPARTGNVIDLMEALQKSIDYVKEKEKAPV